jgi:hypothetical protein
MPALTPPTGHIEAAVVAERYAAASGFAEIDPSYYADQSKVVVDYEVRGRDADQAHVVLRDYTSLKEAAAVVGTYNPAESRWRFFPEFVEKAEQQGLRRLYSYLGPLASNEAIAKGMQAGTPIADPYHSATRKVRAVLRQQLKGCDMTELLQRPEAQAHSFDLSHMPGGAALIVDEGSMTFPTLNPRGPAYAEIEHVAPGETITTHCLQLQRAAELTILCVNALAEDPQNPGRTVRGLRQIMLARRASEDAELWLPDLSVITRKEWEDTFRPVVGTLQAADERYPYFSPMLASIAYNTIDAKPA